MRLVEPGEWRVSRLGEQGLLALPLRGIRFVELATWLEPEVVLRVARCEVDLLVAGIITRKGRSVCVDRVDQLLIKPVA